MIGFIDTFFTISRNHTQSSAEPFFLDCRGLASFSFSFYDRLLIYDWTTYTVSRRTHRKYTLCPAMDICELHRKHRFLYCCIYSALHNNGSYPIVACLFVVAGICLPRRCQQQVYTSQYIYIYMCVCLSGWV
jgi:hypothetical protein